MKEEKEKIVIQLKNKNLVLQVLNFGDLGIDAEELLQVDINEPVMDLITFPVIFNRIGNIKAEIDNLLREVQFDMAAFEAELYEKHRNRLLKDGEKATENAIDMAIKRDPQYKIKKMHVFEVQKQAQIVDSLYWAAKSKDSKLDAISAKLKPEEFETDIVEGVINSVMIRSHKTNFPNRK